MPEVSIIMGVYNAASTLQEALDSIRQQTWSDWECILCDDGSEDESGSLLARAALQDDRFVLLRNEKNAGLAFSLNRCLEVARGTYIARMDADDRMDPLRLEKQVTYLQTHPDFDLTGCFMQCFNETGPGEILTCRLMPEKTDLMKGVPFFHATVLARKEVFERLGGYRVCSLTRRCEDVDLWFRFFAAGMRGCTIPEHLYFVRLDEDACRRRKLKYSIHASILLFRGRKLLELPVWMSLFAIKPVISWMLPERWKQSVRFLFLHSGRVFSQLPE